MKLARIDDNRVTDRPVFVAFEPLVIRLYRGMVPRAQLRSRTPGSLLPHLGCLRPSRSFVDYQ
jgi:hypothetical protein